MKILFSKLFKRILMMKKTMTMTIVVSAVKKKIDRLIFMDYVSGLADKSNEFCNLLKVSQKFGYIYLYIFHIIYLTKSTWQMTLSQTKIYYFFVFDPVRKPAKNFI